jgi:hypothetical protein
METVLTGISAPQMDEVRKATQSLMRVSQAMARQQSLAPTSRAQGITSFTVGPVGQEGK